MYIIELTCTIKCISRTKRLCNSCYDEVVSQKIFATTKISTCRTRLFRTCISKIFSYNGAVAKTGRTKMATLQTYILCNRILIHIHVYC